MTRRHHRRSRGAALVEFGLIAPLLFMLLFGIIEFGWAFLQYLDVRHGAREGARLAAVNYGTSTQIIDETCGRMDTAEGVTMTLAFDVAGETALGDEAVITVSAPLDSLTDFFGSLLEGIELESDVHIRLEEDAEWASQTKACP